MAAITQPSQDGEPGKRYGTFVGRALAGHPVGTITQHTPGGTPGRRYGSFASKDTSVSGLFYIFQGGVFS